MVPKNPIEIKEKSDQELIALILGGDTEVFGEIYDRYSKGVFFKCFSLTRDEATSKDLTHDIMLKVLLKISSYQGDAPMKYWINTIAYNHCMDYLKKRKRLKTIDIDDSNQELVSDDDSGIHEKMILEIRIEELEGIIERLNVNDRLILMMKYFDDMSVRDIAKTMKIGESAVKMRLKRSRDRLGELLKTNV